ncbi:hypothetical protein NDU88_002585 [Pleurodeles waltl]|uniref:Uncharacterized protein n=1 Tax=Pleurodeles waltl TaxID=8319 RepID=A0AAV7KUM1_PLEWA|nr:hypothetical protein NDU88_002585 [Pleurodeles waltl]
MPGSGADWAASPPGSGWSAAVLRRSAGEPWKKVEAVMAWASAEIRRCVVVCPGAATRGKAAWGRAEGSLASVGTVWETLKVYIRGVTISKHAGVLRSISECLCTLERELAQLQVLSTGDQILGRVHAKLTEFQDTALAEVQHMGEYATARCMGSGRDLDRPW